MEIYSPTISISSPKIFRYLQVGPIHTFHNSPVPTLELLTIIGSYTSSPPSSTKIEHGKDYNRSGRLECRESPFFHQIILSNSTGIETLKKKKKNLTRSGVDFRRSISRVSNLIYIRRGCIRKDINFRF